MFYATEMKAGGADRLLATTGPLGLEELRDLVGGPIEVIMLQHGRTLVVNEDGYPLGLGPNVEATTLADLGGPELVGTAVLLHYTLD